MKGSPLDDVTAALTVASVASGLLFVLYRFIRWGHRVLRQLDRLIVIWNGDPNADEDDEARHGLVSRLRTMWRKTEAMEATLADNTRRLDRIESQLTRNGGSTLADAVDRIAKNQGIRGVGE